MYAYTDLSGSLRPDYPADAPPFILPDPLPEPSKKVKVKVQPETPPRTSVKRSLSVMEGEDGVIEIDPTPKKQRVERNPGLSASRTNGKRPENQSPTKSREGESPSKRRRLEEDGLVMMDGENDKLDVQDYIVIDD